MNQNNAITEFNEEQNALAFPDGVGDHYWYHARNRVIEDVIKKQTDHKKILDVGCGRGIAIQHLRSLNYDCWGVDLSKTLPFTGLENVIRSPLKAEELPTEEREKYDCLLLLDVLEHLPDPESFLQSLVSQFPNVNSIVITVPARQELWSNYDVYYGHHRRYHMGLLEELASTINWSLTYKSYFFHFLYLPALLVKKLNSKRDVKFAAPKGLSALFHKCISLLGRCDYFLLPKKLVGSSLICCLKIK